jgi:hypothetical protein
VDFTQVRRTRYVTRPDQQLSSVQQVVTCHFCPWLLTDQRHSPGALRQPVALAALSSWPAVWPAHQLDLHVRPAQHPCRAMQQHKAGAGVSIETTSRHRRRTAVVACRTAHLHVLHQQRSALLETKTPANLQATYSTASQPKHVTNPPGLDEACILSRKPLHEHTYLLRDSCQLARNIQHSITADADHQPTWP